MYESKTTTPSTARRLALGLTAAFFAALASYSLPVAAQTWAVTEGAMAIATAMGSAMAPMVRAK